MTEPSGTPTPSSSAPPLFVVPNRKVIAGTVSDLIMTVITLVAQKHGVTIDPTIDGSVAVLVSALVGLVVAYLVPNKVTS